MSKQETNRKVLYGGLAILFIAFALGVILTNSKEPSPEYAFPEPAEVVKQYFEAWDGKDYANMYAALSDGFKRIEPTAKTLDVFKEYVQSQSIASVEVLSIEEVSNDGSTATIGYNVDFMLSDRSTQPYKGTFTLKYRQGDVIRGWKLIHPYGKNIDTS